MTDRSRFQVCARRAGVGLILLVCVLTPVTAVRAENIPILFYISPADDGSGGPTVFLESGTTKTLAIWADARSAGGGAGLISIQDVRLEASDALVLIGPPFEEAEFTCVAPACRVGTRPTIIGRGVRFAAGDDTSPTPTLSGVFRVGEVIVGANQGVLNATGELRLAAGTALDAEEVGGPLEIEGLPNKGVLIRVPEPAVVLQRLAAIGALAGLVGIRRTRRRNC